MSTFEHITIAYMTNRKDCRIEWFFDSLWWQWQEHPVPITLVVVDFYADDPSRHEAIMAKAKRFLDAGVTLKHVTPKPTVWQGRHRLTKRDYFAPSNARNTALCLAHDGWIAYVDDLSILTPDWLFWAIHAINQKVIGLGTYQKVHELEVIDGILQHCRFTPQGRDSRLKICEENLYPGKPLPDIIPATGSWMFGCSLVAPVQAFLDVNGWDENCDSMGAEDYSCGIMIHNAGYKLMFMPRMITFESEELHHVEPPFLRIDKKDVHGHKDASHAYLHQLISNKMKWAPNYFAPTLATERQRVLAGQPFTMTQIPQHDWRDGQPLTEM